MQIRISIIDYDIQSGVIPLPCFNGRWPKEDPELHVWSFLYFFFAEYVPSNNIAEKPSRLSFLRVIV